MLRWYSVAVLLGRSVFSCLLCAEFHEGLWPVARRRDVLLCIDWRVVGYGLLWSSLMSLLCVVGGLCSMLVLGSGVGWQT